MSFSALMPHRMLVRGLMLLVLALAAMLAIAPAQAAKPDNPGKSQAAKSHKGHDGGHAKVEFRFDDRQRSLIREYFGREFSRGHCPPGLAKKRNGCLPPGQAKKWAIGHPLPHDVIYYDLPAALLRELGRAPEGHKYVRVAADILLIAVGTAMVVDAIEDLSSL